MRLTIQVKLLAAFAAVLALTGILGWMGVSGISTVGALNDQMYAASVLPLQYLGEANVRFHRMRVNLYDHVQSEDQAAMAKVEQTIAEHDKAMLDNLDKYRKTSLSPQEKDELAKFDAGWSAYKSAREGVLKLSRAQKVEEAYAVVKGDMRPKMEAVNDSLDKLVNIQVELAKQGADTGTATETSSRNLAIAVSLLAVLLGFGIAFLLSRSISSAVGKMARAAEGLAAGDVDQKVEVRSSDEIGQTADSFIKVIEYMKEMAAVASAMASGDLSRSVTPRSNKDTLGIAFSQMIANLREMISGVSSSALSLAEASQQLSSASTQAGAATQQISTTIQQVAKGNQDTSTSVQETTASVTQLSRAIDQIARGSQDQSHAIGKTSASVANLNASIAQVAAASQEVTSASKQAHVAATSGAEAVDKTGKGMVAIKASSNLVASKVTELGSYSEQIGSIVETIDDIAEQTNLLALNAAIEAARAGEHGRGFAVVADEVRKLAERAGKSTKEIAALISQIQRGTHEAVSAMEKGTQEVESGTRLAEEAGQALKNILTAVQSATEGVNRIATAAQQMEGVSREVVSQVDSVSAVVEESTAAAEEMAASSQQVTEAIEKVASVSEQTSAAAEEVSASTEEMSAQVEEVVALAESLSQMAEELQAAVAQFDLGEQERGSVATPSVTARRRKDDWSTQDGRKGQIRKLQPVAAR